ncbi:MAG: aminotransferase, partial [Rhodospirillales bacterium]
MRIDPNNNLSLEEMDRQSVMHPLTDFHAHTSGATKPQIIEGGQGIHIFDQDGRDLIDGFAALYCVNIGYGRTEIAEAIYEQAKKLAYFHTYRGTSNEPLIRLSHRLLSLAPANMSKVFYGMSGSDANETQVKIVWYYNNVLGRPGKKKIISRQRAYHGCTIMAGSLTGLDRFHKTFDLPLGPVLHTLAPHYYWGAEAGMSELDYAKRCAEALDVLIESEGPDTVAAFIAEPVMGTGGIVPPPKGYWQLVQEVLDKHDVLLIADEVVCGFGRVGANFGCDLYGIRPDLVTVAKGLTSAYLPLSGAIVGKSVWDVLEQGSEIHGPFSHGYTYSGHALGAAAAMANLDVIDREGLVANARDMGGLLRQRLHEAFDDHPMVGEIRGVGLLAAVEFVADRARKERFDPALSVGRRVTEACLEQGLIARAMPGGDTLGFAPPLVIRRDEIERIVEI